MTVSTIDTPEWSAQQALLAAGELVSDGDSAMIVVSVDGDWKVVTSSVGCGDLLIAAEIMKMLGIELLAVE